MDGFRKTLKATALAVAPIVAVVLILSFTAVPVGLPLIINFLIGSVLIVLGLSVFLIGVNLSIMPLGSYTGEALSKTKRLWVLVLAGIILGFFVSLAEPGLIVLANQVDLVTMGRLPAMNLLIYVSVGFAVVLSIGLRRIFSKIPFYLVILPIYLVIGAASLLISPEFLALAFDASGATTGIMAVPFILALGVGVSSRKKDSIGSEEDSFGLVAMASAGAIIGVIVLQLVLGTAEYDSGLPIETAVTDSIFQSFIRVIPKTLYEGLVTLLPLPVVFLLLRLTVLKLSRNRTRKMIMGFIYSFFGLVIFFLGVNGGFMDVGTVLGYNLALKGNDALTIAVGFLIGLITIAAEPAVYVQTNQIESVTSGHIKRKTVLVPLCAGVGCAVMLAVIRILVPAVQLWHYLLPGYIVALGLTFFTPKLFVGIAFDAGGGATGPMTGTFILSFTQGIAASREGANLLLDGFGMIALVALFPIITLQILGLIYKIKTRKRNEKSLKR
ncbi:MAG: DUF1538 domain-containing protein [Oscillospiraceae bacterium]|nr:DUF1538 domain-containing protein [Oscillospiraceae bacterium]